MLLPILIKLFDRDLKKLRLEIELYQSEAALWQIAEGINNSGGNLCLHLIGNLNAYIGATLGNSGYIRQRELEFSLKDIPKAELLQKIDATLTVVERTLSQLNESDLDKEYPLLVFAEKTSTRYFLVHLATHLTYHLGQINYHRRLLTG